MPRRQLHTPLPPAMPSRFHPIAPDSSSLRGSASECARAHGGRPYQVELAHDIVGALETPILQRGALAESGIVSSALVVVPTGGGKTHVALSVVTALQQHANVTVGWCAARRELLAQAKSEARAFGFAVEFEPISLFAKSPPQVDVLVWDEAHRDACTTAASLAARTRPRYTIGLTATPWRSDRAQLSYGHELRRCSIQRLQDEGYLSQYAHLTIEDWQPQTVAARWLEDRSTFGSSIMFFRTHAEGHACVDALKAGGARASLVHGASDREAQLDAFVNGQCDVLVAMGCLTEGISIPSLGTVFARPACQGATVQMCGRVLRPHAERPVKWIVQARATPYPFVRLARPAEQHEIRGGTWRALSSTRRLDEVAAQMRRAIARMPLSPPGVVNVKPRTRFGPPAARGVRAVQKEQS